MAGNLNNGTVQSRPQVHSRTSLPRQLQHQLNLQRNASMFCDVTLKVQGAEFPVHRCVLAAFSPHFSLLFSDCNRTVVELNSLTEEGVRAVINFMYTSNIILSQDNIVAVSAAAWFLQISELTQDCQMFLTKNLHRGENTPVNQGNQLMPNTPVQMDCTNSRGPDNTSRLQRLAADLQKPRSTQEASGDGRPTGNEPGQFTDQSSDAEAYCNQSSHDNKKIKQDPSIHHSEDVFNPVQKQPMNTMRSEPGVHDIITIDDEEEDEEDSMGTFAAEDAVRNFDSSTHIGNPTSPEQWTSSGPLEHRVTTEGFIVSDQGNGDIFTRNLPYLGVGEMNPGARPYECGQCGFRFKTFSHLKSHVRIHTGEKPYRCDLCPSRFGRKDHLTVHRRTHTGEKPYNCPVCPSSFAQKPTLNIHMQRRHKMHKETLYKCSQCIESFSNRISLMNHMLSHEQQIQCPGGGSTGVTLPNNSTELVSLPSGFQYGTEQEEEKPAGCIGTDQKVVYGEDMPK